MSEIVSVMVNASSLDCSKSNKAITMEILQSSFLKLTISRLSLLASSSSLFSCSSISLCLFSACLFSSSSSSASNLWMYSSLALIKISLDRLGRLPKGDFLNYFTGNCLSRFDLNLRDFISCQFVSFFFFYYSY